MQELASRLNEAIPNPYLLVMILTLLPAMELRLSIPYGYLVLKLSLWQVVGVAIVTNILLGPVVFFLLDKFLHLLLKVKWINKLWDRIVVRTQKKIHPYVEKYGTWGLGLFIGVPLPGSGVYSGAAGGYVLGFTKKEFYLATVIGVLIAAAAVAIVTFTGSEAMQFFTGMKAATT